MNKGRRKRRPTQGVLEHSAGGPRRSRVKEHHGPTKNYGSLALGGARFSDGFPQRTFCCFYTGALFRALCANGRAGLANMQAQDSRFRHAANPAADGRQDPVLSDPFSGLSTRNHSGNLTFKHSPGSARLGEPRGLGSVSIVGTGPGPFFLRGRGSPMTRNRRLSELLEQLEATLADTHAAVERARAALLKIERSTEPPIVPVLRRINSQVARLWAEVADVRPLVAVFPVAWNIHVDPTVPPASLPVADTAAREVPDGRPIRALCGHTPNEPDCDFCAEVRARPCTRSGCGHPEHHHERRTGICWSCVGTARGCVHDLSEARS